MARKKKHRAFPDGHAYGQHHSKTGGGHGHHRTNMTTMHVPHMGGDGMAHPSNHDGHGEGKMHGFGALHSHAEEDYAGDGCHADDDNV
jgi:hypothetical protein